MSAQLSNSINAFQSLASVDAPVLKSLRARPAQPRPQVDAVQAAEQERARTREAVGQAERQRDAINAKQQRIDQLQKGIDSYDRMIQEIRSRGGDASFFTKKSEELLRQKRDLQRSHLGGRPRDGAAHISSSTTSPPAREHSRLMSKTLRYTLATIGDLVFAYFAWQSGRVVMPIILLFAALCFAAAAIGSALGKGGSR